MFLHDESITIASSNKIDFRFFMDNQVDRGRSPPSSYGHQVRIVPKKKNKMVREPHDPSQPVVRRSRNNLQIIYNAFVMIR